MTLRDNVSGSSASTIDASDPTGWSAADYATVNGNQVRSALAAIALAEQDKLSQNGQFDASGLAFADIGCGAGEIAHEMASRGYAVYACDYSRSMVEETARRCTDAGVEVVQADANELILFPRTFDVIHSSWVLHWVTEIDMLLDTLVGALRPGGHVVLQWNAGHAADQPDGQFGILREVAERPRWREQLVQVPFTMRRHPSDHIVARLRAANLEIVNRVDDLAHPPVPDAPTMTLIDVRERVKRTGMGQQITALGADIDDFLDEAIALMVERGDTSLRDSRIIARRPIGSDRGL